MKNWQQFLRKTGLSQHEPDFRRHNFWRTFRYQWWWAKQTRVSPSTLFIRVPESCSRIVSTRFGKGYSRVHFKGIFAHFQGIYKGFWLYFKQVVARNSWFCIIFIERQPFFSYGQKIYGSDGRPISVCACMQERKREILAQRKGLSHKITVFSWIIKPRFVWEAQILLSCAALCTIQANTVYLQKRKCHKNSKTFPKIFWFSSFKWATQSGISNPSEPSRLPCTLWPR